MLIFNQLIFCLRELVKKEDREIFFLCHNMFFLIGERVKETGSSFELPAISLIFSFFFHTAIIFAFTSRTE